MGSLDVSAAAVSCGDRFEWFCETVSSDLMPVSISTQHTTGFRAKITELDLGAVRLSTFAFSPVMSRRTSAHVRRGDPEQFQLALVTRGAFRISQLGHESVIDGDLVLTDTSRPMENEGVGADGLVEAVVLQIPRTALPLRSGRVDRLLGQRIPVSGGTTAILAEFLGTLLSHGPQCGGEEINRLGSMTLDLATACLAQQLGALDEAPAEARAQVMRQRINAFIEHNLGDPELTPQAIADRYNISLRTLYNLFREEPFSVAATIRSERIERCRVDLACRDLSSQPVQAIAARWGFSSATAFGRAFREAHGMTPTEYRTNALHT
ncbi:helix-turn-helix domain-containing protein [Streptomyces lunaelactis]|uniref:helix-turn-helix domain-containing protein n=1 Tax=Streptomyces lunaelactis TaxID=1535768 RepID=UPI001585CCD3|nr:helix-turn-helix domain-containing protein [Streptomyces lunaelactis]NUK15331.1 helix-turn-helix domain-containing protein [Streptomyces lunaelactis]